MFRIAVLTAGFLAAILLAPAAAEEAVCPEGTHTIYTSEGELVSCEELIGTPAGCPEDAEPGYLEDGTLAGCFTSSVIVEEVCAPIGEDTDEDSLDDGCDPCPENADCDADGFCDGLEVYLVTDPQAACPDGPSHPAWPLDINNDGVITVSFDVLNFRNRITATPDDPDWWQRLDLNGDGILTVSGDVLSYRHKIGTSCGDEAGAPPMAVCWACIEWPYTVGTRDVHIHGEFNWTVHWPWPIDDWVSTKYEMDMRASFIWLNGLNIAGLGKTSAWAWAEWPFYIFDDPTITAGAGDGLSSVYVEAMAYVEVLPGITSWPATYPIKLWIKFWVPGYIHYGEVNFHYVDIHDE